MDSPRRRGRGGAAAATWIVRGDGVAQVRGSPFEVTCQEAWEYVAAHPKDFKVEDVNDVPAEAMGDVNAMDGPLLVADIAAKIKDIRDFSAKKKRGLAKLDPQNYDDMDPLIEGKEHLRDIARNAEQYALTIDATRAALAHLKGRGNPVDRLVDQLGKAVVDWTEVLGLVEPTAHAITPTTIHFAKKTDEAMSAYELKVQSMDETFRASPCFTSKIAFDDATKMLDKFEKEFTREMLTLEENANLCAVFEFPEKIDIARGVLKTMQALVGFMRDCWAVAEDVGSFISGAKALLWRELEIEDLEDGSKAQTKKLSGLNKAVKKCGLYVDVNRDIKDFINTIPLIAALRSPSMRPRHWELLRKATGKEFVPPHEDEDLQLGGLLSLNLHEYGRRADLSLPNRGDAAAATRDLPWRRDAATPRIFRGDETRRRRGRDVGSSVETRRRDAKI